MPRRTIVIGKQPSAFEFQDDFGPLNNGLAYAAGQWLASGRDRAQIEMQREAQAQQEQTHDTERQQDLSFRNQDMELRKLALGQQDQQRKDALGEQKAYHDEQATRYADELKQKKAKDDSESWAKWRDDIGSTVKYGLDWFRGGNPANASKDGAHAGTDLNQKKFNWERAVQMVGAPDYDLDTVTSTDGMGNPVEHQIKRPLTESQRAERVKSINRKFRELNGEPPDPNDAPAITPDDPHGSGRGFVPSAPSSVTGSLSDMALGGTPASASSMKETAPAEKVSPARFNEALTRANKALVDSMPGRAAPGTAPTITDEQRAKLAHYIAGAQQGHPDAMKALLHWHQTQPDTVARDRQDQKDGEAALSTLEAMMMH